MFKSDKKGLSTVVTTLILVLLVIVAIVIVWGVIQNLIFTKVEEVSFGQKCLDGHIRVSASCTQTGTSPALSHSCDLTFIRDDTKSDLEIAKVNVVLRGTPPVSVANQFDLGPLLPILGSHVITNALILTSEDRITGGDFVIGFLDEGNNVQYCEGSVPVDVGYN